MHKYNTVAKQVEPKRKLLAEKQASQPRVSRLTSHALPKHKLAATPPLGIWIKHLRLWSTVSLHVISISHQPKLLQVQIESRN